MDKLKQRIDNYNTTTTYKNLVEENNECNRWLQDHKHYQQSSEKYTCNKQMYNMVKELHENIFLKAQDIIEDIIRTTIKDDDPNKDLLQDVFSEIEDNCKLKNIPRTIITKTKKYFEMSEYSLLSDNIKNLRTHRATFSKNVLSAYPPQISSDNFKPLRNSNNFSQEDSNFLDKLDNTIFNYYSQSFKEHVINSDERQKWLKDHSDYQGSKGYNKTMYLIVSDLEEKVFNDAKNILTLLSGNKSNELSKKHQAAFDDIKQPVQNSLKEHQDILDQLNEITQHGYHSKNQEEEKKQGTLLQTNYNVTTQNQQNINTGLKTHNHTQNDVHEMQKNFQQNHIQGNIIPPQKNPSTTSKSPQKE